MGGFISQFAATENQTTKIVVFVIGGPGCGKETFCERLEPLFDYDFISADKLMQSQMHLNMAAIGSLKKTSSSCSLSETSVSATKANRPLCVETLRKAVTASKKSKVIM
jgi:shikimate kinase